MNFVEVSEKPTPEFPDPLVQFFRKFGKVISTRIDSDSEHDEWMQAAGEVEK